ncbi:hypothetical protein [Streptomyces sp. NBC_01190]|uniref:hypothetical protein n=1 Tax=Streptomyces sp. NBC_01190 TaxID=2903767 RepID=UPI003867D25A|nr:hypothetical protein OG519_01835 [Streptomyces sp. NBC_01190]
MEGSRALPALWRILAEALRTGEQAALSRQAPAGSPVRAALGTVIEQLRAHDVLVRQTTEPEGVASRWLHAVAEDPGAAATALAAARVRVLAADPEGSLAQAAGRALTASGAVPSYGEEGDVPGQILLLADGPGEGHQLAVAAAVSGGTAFVTAPGSPAQARADATALTARLRLSSDSAPDRGEPVRSGVLGPSAVSGASALPVSPGVPAPSAALGPSAVSGASALTVRPVAPGRGEPGPPALSVPSAVLGPSVVLVPSALQTSPGVSAPPAAPGRGEPGRSALPVPSAVLDPSAVSGPPALPAAPAVQSPSVVSGASALTVPPAVQGPSVPELSNLQGPSVLPEARALPDPQGPLVALVAGAAAHRLVCAVAGLPDPAEEGEDQRVLADRPAVLVAGARPLRADYHAWLGPDLLDADRSAPPAVPGTLAEALARVAALGDELVGVLPAPTPGALPQLPVALVTCPVRGGTLCAGSARVDLARLDAICRAAELRLAAPDSTVTVGVDLDHAWGRALRREAARLPWPAGPELPAAEWAAHPQARHWWTTLTVRLCTSATLSVVPLAPGEAVCRATVRDASGRLLGVAVEATPGDAAAFAALAATAHVQSVATGMTVRQQTAPSGAVTPIATAGTESAGWEDDGWTTAWLAGLATREAPLQSALRRLTGLRPQRENPRGPDPDPEARAITAALHGCGFAILTTPGGAE